MVHGLKHVLYLHELCNLLQQPAQKLFHKSDQSTEIVARVLSLDVSCLILQLADQEIGRFPSLDPVDVISTFFPDTGDACIQLGCVSNTSISKASFLTLRNNSFLNDEVIRVMLSLELDQLQDSRILIADSSLFFPSTSYEKIFDVSEETSLIILPVHHGHTYQHWSLIRISILDSEVQHLDSAWSLESHQRIKGQVETILAATAKIKTDFNADWKFVAKDVLTQQGIECGIHCIANGIACMNGDCPPKELDTCQLRVDYARRILLEIVKQLGYGQESSGGVVIGSS